MTLSMIFAWLAVVFAVLAALRYPARKLARAAKKPAVNRVSHRLHVPTGIFAAVFAIAHGLLAGNFPGEIPELAALLFTLNWGTLCLILMLLLSFGCMLKRVLKQKWMPLHRLLTILLIAVLAVHLFDVGIHLPERLFSQQDKPGISVEHKKNTPKPNLSAAPIMSVPPTPTASPALLSSEPAAETEPTPTPEPTPEPQNLFDGVALEDGRYTGSADGYSSTITVEVTVQDGAVVSIEVVDEAESKRYFARAEAVLDEIVAAQSTDVDAVTGATYSSQGLMEAVRDALQL